MVNIICGMKFKGRVNYNKEREDINFEDGGQVIVYYFVL